VEDAETDRLLRLARFDVEFSEELQTLAVAVEVGECMFPDPGVYTIKVEFTSPAGEEVQKGETFLSVLQTQE
jgi:hypothetical protein